MRDEQGSHSIGHNLTCRVQNSEIRSALCGLLCKVQTCLGTIVRESQIGEKNIDGSIAVEDGQRLSNRTCRMRVIAVFG